MRRTTVLICVFLAAALTGFAQGFKEIGPPPVDATTARQQVRTLLDAVNPSNRKETGNSLSHLATWYRDLIDEELIAAWRRDTRANLPGLIEDMADPLIATSVVGSSWRELREATFIPAYAPMLGHLMARYPDSASGFLNDLLSSESAGNRLALTRAEAETVCRILLDMPDIRTFRKNALEILPVIAMSRRLCSMAI